MLRRWEKYFKRGQLGALLSGRAPHAFLLLVLALSVSLGLKGIKGDSPTEDEWAHLTRGISYWQGRDMRIHVQHPPLANALAGLPSAFDDNPDMSQMRSWQEGYAPGLEYIKHDYAKARGQLAKGRYVAMLFLVALVAYVFYFCLSVFGWPTAAAAAILIAFNPTLLGHARYVATDLPVATMATIAVGELVRYLVKPVRIVTLGLALAGLVLAKHSGAVFVGMLGLVSLIVAIAGKGAFRGKPPARRIGTWAVHWAIAGAIVIFSVNAVYKFDRTFMTVHETLDAPEPQHWVTSRFKHSMLETRTFLPKLPESLRIPLPYAYVFGLFAVQEQNRRGYPSYFLGTSSRDGHWAYFPVLLILKNPPALLFLLGLGVVVLFRKTPRRSWARASSATNSTEPSQAKAATESSEPSEVAATAESSEPSQAKAAAPSQKSKLTLEREPLAFGLSLASACFLAVMLMLLIFLMRSRLNMGIRHALPVIPLGSVLAARAFARASEVFRGDALLASRMFGMSGIISAVLVMPHYLNYYNFLAFGEGSYINVVGDDWGQDRAAFVSFAKKQQLEPLYYHTQTPTRKLEVDYLGLKYRSLDCKTRPKPGSWVAIHVQYVRRFEADEKCARWMRGIEPTHKVNDNIWIYKVPDN